MMLTSRSNRLPDVDAAQRDKPVHIVWPVFVAAKARRETIGGMTAPGGGKRSGKRPGNQADAERQLPD
jgi:hypothetical protein